MRNRLEQGLKHNSRVQPTWVQIQLLCVCAVWPWVRHTIPLCFSVLISKKTPSLLGGIIANIFAVVVSLRERYRAFLARPGTPPLPRQGLTAWGPLHHETHYGEVKCELWDPPVPSTGLEAEAGAGRKRAGGQCSALELARNRHLSWSL